MIIDPTPARKLPPTTLWIIAVAMILLAVEPVRWLVGTWYLPGYEGTGIVAALLVVVLVLASCLSPLRAFASPPAHYSTFVLLAITASLRCVSQWLDIQVIGALLLVVDVYALASWARLDQRRLALSPLWLAALFAFALPIEPMLQRLLGFPLQQISADVACALLSPLTQNLSCTGVRLQVEGVDVLVDLPCSGAAMLSNSALMLALIHSLVRPGFRAAVVSLVLWLGLALIGNGIRIAALALGLAHAESLGFDVMAPIPHSLIGLVIVGLVSVVSAALALALSARLPRREALRSSFGEPVGRLASPRAGRLGALCFLFVAASVGIIQPQPVDASPPLPPPRLPLVAAGYSLQAQDLSAAEQRYFTQYGGGASKGTYGPFSLLLVTTASPLRHLHEPAICWQGSGYDVELLGTDHDRNMTVYEAHHRGDERAYRLSVQYLSSAGEAASSVGEVVWRWFRQPQTRWTMIQKIEPLTPQVSQQLAYEWQQAVSRAFDS